MNLLERLIDKIYTIITKRKFKYCGKNVKIKFPVTIVNPQKISIEDNVFIGEHVWLNAGTINTTNSINNHNNDDLTLFIKKGSYISRFTHINAFHSVKIMENVLIGENVYIGDADHSYKDKSKPIINQKIEIKNKVIIDTGSHICKNAVVNSGVSVGKNAIVGPNVFLTNNLPDHSIAIGNTATIIDQNV
jgi:acetyltransferase-like isoleucine patch superfamily enzyme